MIYKLIYINVLFYQFFKYLILEKIWFNLIHLYIFLQIYYSKIKMKNDPSHQTDTKQWSCTMELYIDP